MSTFEKAAAPHATAPTDFSLSTTSTEKLGFQTKDAAQTLPPQTQTEFAEINKDDLWRAHVHLGHLKNKWNPKMKPFIYGYRYKLHILNWKKIILALDRTRHFFYRLGQEQKKILFVGTKPQAQWVIKTAAQQTFNFYVCNRWLGGTLTNTQTLRKRIKRLWTLAQNFKINALQWFPKQERLKLAKEKTKLEGFFEGIKMMHTQPAVLFVVNPDHEITALKEAKKQGITTVGICDTNSDPTLLDYCIPGNDDSVTSIFTLVQYLVQAYCQGIGLVYERPVIPETELKKSEP